MVMLHISVGYLPLWFEQTRFSWWVANGFDSLSRVCVPWLLMVSGALLLPQLKDLDWRQFYQKRMIRLLRPWIFWSLVFGLLNLWQGNEVSSVKRLVVSTVWTGFWLLPVFVGVYALAPWWQKFAQKVALGWKWLLIVVGLAVLIAGIHLPLYAEYFVYFVLGNELTILPLKKIGRRLGLGVWLFGWLAVMILTFQLSVANRGFVSTFYHYHTWPVVLMSLGGFYWFSQVRVFWQKILTQKYALILQKLSHDSFQLYFIHLLFFRLGINWSVFPTLVFIPANSALIFGLSWAGVNLLRIWPRCLTSLGAKDKSA